MYDERGLLVGFNDGTKTYLYTRNLQGDIVAITDTATETVVATYTYDSWGNVLTGTGTMAEVNPFRYRGYYYDTETGLYYLQSRYYDAEVGRFLNADGVLGANGDMHTYNLYVYCGNNPIMRADSSGRWWITALLVAAIVAVCTTSLTGCAEQVDYGAATEYKESNSTKYNCYAYALGETKWRYVGGHQDAVKNFDVENVATMVEQDVKKTGRTIRRIDGYDSPINSNEYRIAMRTGKNDYHFMLQHNDGSWSHKPGICSTRLIKGKNPDAVTWDAPTINNLAYSLFGKIIEVGCESNYYNSKTIYFAISK